jgi:hypothetical protein
MPPRGEVSRYHIRDLVTILARWIGGLPPRHSESGSTRGSLDYQEIPLCSARVFYRQIKLIGTSFASYREGQTKCDQDINTDCKHAKEE